MKYLHTLDPRDADAVVRANEPDDTDIPTLTELLDAVTPNGLNFFALNV